MKGLILWSAFAYGIFYLLVAGFDVAKKQDIGVKYKRAERVSSIR